MTSDAAAKQFIATYGPIQAAMDVYDDFLDVNSDAFIVINKEIMQSAITPGGPRKTIFSALWINFREAISLRRRRRKS